MKLNEIQFRDPFVLIIAIPHFIWNCYDSGNRCPPLSAASVGFGFTPNVNKICYNEEKYYTLRLDGRRCFNGKGIRFYAYKSADLISWNGPFKIFHRL
ncbi:MAG: hypothetical protein FWE74_08160 [Oscillospiraceae bacterium]|nr:hypothetical protein [Oscillospiraceae bacterium]